MNSIYVTGKSAAERVENLREYVTLLKQALADDLMDSTKEGGRYFPSERIAKAANEIAVKEAELEVAHLIVSAERNEVSKETLAKMLLREALRSPDDSWSGRTNDVKRAFNDGRRDALDDANMDLMPY